LIPHPAFNPSVVAGPSTRYLSGSAPYETHLTAHKKKKKVTDLFSEIFSTERLLSIGRTT